VGSVYDPLTQREISSEKPRACSTCPWRVDVQENPPEGFTRLEGDEAARTRHGLWEGGIHTPDWTTQGIRKGIKDGNAVVCHQADAVFNPDTAPAAAKPCLCAPTIALKQRCVLRWIFGGTREPLTFEGARQTIADMWGCDPWAIEAGWIVGGEKITGDRLVELAHPLTFDANIACEGVPPPSDKELRRWQS
jgi:hypothetical protein